MINLFCFPEPLSNSEHRQHFIDRQMWSEFFDHCGQDKPNLDMIGIVRALIEDEIPMADDRNAMIISGHPESCKDDIVGWLRKYVKRHYDWEGILTLRPDDFRGDSVALRQHWHDTFFDGMEIGDVYEHFQKDKDFWKGRIKGEVK